MNSNRLPRLTYYNPNTIEEVLDLKETFAEDAVILAGGTDVVPMLKRRNVSCGHVINIKKIRQLQQIAYDGNEGLRVGAAVTLRDVSDHPVISDTYPLLGKAVQAVAYNQIRNMGTLVGNICVDNKCTYFNQSAFWWQSRPDCFKRGGDRCYVVKGGRQCYALSAGDTVSALIALEASVYIVAPAGERRIPVQDFYTGDGQCPQRLGEGEFVTAVLIPPPTQGWRDGFLKKSQRGSVDFAIATLSIRLRNNGKGLEDVRIALNGVSSKPIRAEGAEQYLIGKSIDDATIGEAARILLKETTPLSSIGASVQVRRRMIEAMFTDLIETLKV
jgi:4-hydroxybenzoyl-CoA reductase subunit beta